MNSRERVQAVLTGKPADRLPVDFHFADDTALQVFAGHYNMGEEEFLTYLENDVRHLYVMDEVELFLQNRPLMRYAFDHGFAYPNPEDPALCFDQLGDRMEYGERRAASGFQSPEGLGWIGQGTGTGSE